MNNKQGSTTQKREEKNRKLHSNFRNKNKIESRFGILIRSQLHHSTVD